MRIFNGARVLAIGAHPDDVEIGCLGSLIQSSDTIHSLHHLIITMSSERLVEQGEACSLIADEFASYTWSSMMYNDDQVLNTREDDIKFFIEEIIRTQQIDLVLVHYPKDTHSHHRTVSRAATDAGRNCSVMYYHSANSVDFNPNCYVAIDKYSMDIKYEALSCHASQIEKNNGYYLRKINAVASYYGQAINADFAEGFHIHKLIN